MRHALRTRYASLLRLVAGSTYAASALAQTASTATSSSAQLSEPVVEVVIVASAPGRGTGLREDQVAGSVQRVDSAQIRAARGATLADALQQNVAGISLSDAQGNAFSPDLSYRGFTASPLLGLPQGLAVYQNGTRLNEPFGDTLAWELIPELAIREATLITGLNPTYGLNALGGALSLLMKDGFTFHGARASGLGGSFGRLRASLEAGTDRAGWAVYTAGDVVHEDGWRDHSPSDVRRLYVDLRHRDAGHELGLNASFANSDLTGNGPAPVDLLAVERRAVFTYPDQTKTALMLVGADGHLSLGRNVDLNATAFFRRSLRRTVNGDEAELVPCPTNPGVLCEAQENAAPEPLTSANGLPIAASAGGDAVLNATHTDSTSGGGTVQIVARQPLLDRDNQLTLGVAADTAVSRFEQRSEVGTLQEDRGVTGSGIFRANDASEVELDVFSTQLGLYAADTFALWPQLSLTLAARMNWFSLKLRDRLGDELNGDHSFRRLNPAAGLAYSPKAGLVVYAHYTEANRAPTAAELSCADPEEPCRLPNAFLSDPPLEQVVTRSVELGARWRHESEDGTSELSVSLAGFAARNLNDILFVAGSLVGTGYFRNAGATQRAGVEASATARLGRVEPYLRYQLLRATFESSLLLPGDNHPGATATPDGNVIFVEPGDRIPGLPLHTAQLGVDLRALDALSLGAWVHLDSSRYYRGDEANLLRPLPGYLSLNARASYEVSSFVSLFARAENLLATSFETFGLLGQAEEVIPEATNPRFEVPSPGISFWMGLDVQLSR